MTRFPVGQAAITVTKLDPWSPEATPLARRPGHLHELDGDLPAAAAAYAAAAGRTTNVAERDHLVRQAARARAAEL